MNIFEQAMDLEKQAAFLYRQFSLEATDRGMKYVFAWLADQEQKHYRVFQEMKAAEPAPVVETPVLEDVQNVFEDWKDHLSGLDIKSSQADIYRQALALEIQSASVYEKYAGTAPLPQKATFLRIASEEKLHQRIITNVIAFVTRPEEWVENAEFSHLGEDY